MVVAVGDRHRRDRVAAQLARELDDRQDALSFIASSIKPPQTRLRPLSAPLPLSTDGRHHPRRLASQEEEAVRPTRQASDRKGRASSVAKVLNAFKSEAEATLDRPAARRAK